MHVVDEARSLLRMLAPLDPGEVLKADPHQIQVYLDKIVDVTEKLISLAEHPSPHGVNH